MKWLRKYWWIIVIAIILTILMPVGLNFILSHDTPWDCSVIGEPKDWLNFWGGYLGSAIMAGVTLYVLHKQLKQNHEENEENRNANEQANEKNRKLQIRVLEYQQQMQWLNLFRQASVEYVQLYNTNDLREIANMIESNPQGAHSIVKALLDRAELGETRLAYLCKTDEHAKILKDALDAKFTGYNKVLQDIQEIIAFRLNNPSASCSQLVNEGTSNGTSLFRSLSQEMRGEMGDYTQKVFCRNFMSFSEIVQLRISDIKDDFGIVRNLLCVYIREEQERIDKITEG